MNCSARTEEWVTGRWPVAEPGTSRPADVRTRDRQAAVSYLRSAGAAEDDAERGCLRRLAARLVLSNPD